MLHKLSQRPHKKKQGIHDPNEVYMARGAMENINPLKPMPLQQIRQNQNDLEKHHNVRGFSNKARKESKDGRRKPLKELNSSPYLAPLVQQDVNKPATRVPSQNKTVLQNIRKSKRAAEALTLAKGQLSRNE